MKIFLMRHGIASEPGGSRFEVDARRQLTDAGREKIHKIAHALKELEIKPDLILSSPFVRAEQTAAILAREYDMEERLKFSDLLVPAGKAEAILDEITEKYMVEELLLVSHEPCLSLLISALAAGGPDLSITLKKGGVCCLSANDLRIERRATIEWLITPGISLKV